MAAMPDQTTALNLKINPKTPPTTVTRV